MKASTVTAVTATAGLSAGAAAWSFHQEAGFVVASFVCGGEAEIWIFGAAALVILGLGALLSWLALRTFGPEQDVDAIDGFRARRFLARVSIMIVAIFFFAIVMQGTAVLFLPACTA